jgi:hypothetical protein
LYNGLIGFSTVLTPVEFWCPICRRKFVSVTRGLGDAIQKLFESHIHFDGRYFYCSECLTDVFKVAKLAKDDDKNYKGFVNFSHQPDVVSYAQTENVENIETSEEEGDENIEHEEED